MIENTRYRNLTAGLIAAWFVVVLSASSLHVFAGEPNRPPIALGIAALLPIAVFLIWYAASPRFRQFTLSLDPRLLTLAQTWRIAGFAFLVLYAYKLLPGLFAWPAGLGDMAIGLTALFAATRLTHPSNRGPFLLWQTLGITDLVTAISLGASAGFLNPQGIPTAPMALLPLSIIPVFAVPLLLILHLICIGQALGWRNEPLLA